MSYATPVVFVPTTGSAAAAVVRAYSLPSLIVAKSQYVDCAARVDTGVQTSEPFQDGGVARGSEGEDASSTRNATCEDDWVKLDRRREGTVVDALVVVLRRAELSPAKNIVLSACAVYGIDQRAWLRAWRVGVPGRPLRSLCRQKDAHSTSLTYTERRPLGRDRRDRRLTGEGSRRHQ